MIVRIEFEVRFVFFPSSLENFGVRSDFQAVEHFIEIGTTQQVATERAPDFQRTFGAGKSIRSHLKVAALFSRSNIAGIRT
jgi:hypothetical protein